MKKKFKKGVSFIEMLVYLSVLVIVLVVVVSFLIWMNKASLKTKAQREVLDDAAVVLRKISYETKSAQSIYSPATFSSQLSLATLHYLPPSESLTYIDFFICGTRVCLKKEFEEPVFLTSPKTKVQYLRFDILGQGAVKVGLGLSHAFADEALSVTSTFSLRDYE